MKPYNPDACCGEDCLEYDPAHPDRCQGDVLLTGGDEAVYDEVGEIVGSTQWEHHCAAHDQERNRCDYKGGGYVQCCQPKGHDGPHLYKCSGRHCPGLPWLASNTAHPAECNWDEEE